MMTCHGSFSTGSNLSPNNTYKGPFTNDVCLIFGILDPPVSIYTNEILPPNWSDFG